MKYIPTQEHIMNRQFLKVLISTVFLLLASNAIWAQQTRAPTAAKAEIVPVESTSMNFSKVVPAGKQYYIYNDKGRKTGTIKAGQSTAGETNCAQIPCPSTFGDDVVCWKCVETITAGGTNTE